LNEELHHRILAAVQLGLSNSKLESLNSKIRLINHRGYGHHSAAEAGIRKGWGRPPGCWRPGPEEAADH
jgi:hypothetical protein